MIKDEKEVNFLDVRVWLEEGQLHTGLYSKETDRNNLLHKESFHAPQVFRRIPKGKFMRARRICSSEKEYSEDKLIDKFLTKGHKKMMYKGLVKK